MSPFKEIFSFWITNYLGTHEVSIEDDVRLAFRFVAKNYFIGSAVGEE
jgi:hypothetical protein